MSALCLALACGKTEDDPQANPQGGNGAGGGSFGGSASGGDESGGRTSGGATSGGASSGGSASGGDNFGGGASGGADLGGAGGEAGGATGGMSTGGTAGSATGGTGGEVTTMYRGSISITNAAEREPSKFTVSPSFATLGTGSSCRRVTHGDCVVSDMCAYTANLPNYVSAGSVRVAIPARNVEVVGEPSAAMGFSPLYRLLESEEPFQGDDVLEVSASGGNVVPAFMTKISVPQPLRVHAPAPEAEGVIRAPRSKDITLDVQVTAQVATLEIRGASSLSTKQVMLSCSAKAWGAPVVIAGAALDALGYPLRLSIRTLHPASLVVGDWRVDMPVTFEVIDENQAVIDAIVVD